MRRAHAVTAALAAAVMAARAGAFMAGAPGAEAPPAADSAAREPIGGEATLRLAPDDEPGVRLTVDGTVRARDGSPAAGASLRAYQTDATGWYTRERPMDEPHARLSGDVRADAKGRFRLVTIRPVGYPEPLRLGDRDRKIPAHIHLDVSAPGHDIRRLQVVFADDPLLEDPYWIDWVRRLGQPVLATRVVPGGLAGDLSITLP